jgi:hypothetical protein
MNRKAVKKSASSEHCSGLLLPPPSPSACCLSQTNLNTWHPLPQTASNIETEFQERYVISKPSLEKIHENHQWLLETLCHCWPQHQREISSVNVTKSTSGWGGGSETVVAIIFRTAVAPLHHHLI